MGHQLTLGILGGCEGEGGHKGLDLLPDLAAVGQEPASRAGLAGTSLPTPVTNVHAAPLLRGGTLRTIP